MNRGSDLLRLIAVAASLLGVAFLFAPVNTDVVPPEVPVAAALSTLTAGTRARADSLTEDIILHNLFSPSRTAPSQRYGTSSAVTGDAMDDATATARSPNAGFTPELVGTAVSDRPGETRALLRLIASDPGPRLYAVGDRAGGYAVVSIDARSVVLSGPRGRVVLRLPEHEESHS